jgi:hypothetical protein
LSKVRILTRGESCELFTMFHDFDIVDIIQGKDFTTFFIHIPWGQLWNDDDYVMMLQVFDCTDITCDYVQQLRAKPPETEEGSFWEPIAKQTTDLELIKGLGLCIQEHKFYLPDEYAFLCSGSGLQGQLRFKAADFKIFDKKGKEITLDVFKDWAIQWWNSIQKIWDE